MSRSHRVVTWLSCGAIAAVCAFVAPTASADPYVDVRIAPPAVRVESPPPRPSAHHFWVHGYYNWNGREHIWVPGRYEVERTGYGYREGRWEGGRGHYHYIQGGWYRR